MTMPTAEYRASGSRFWRLPSPPYLPDDSILGCCAEAKEGAVYWLCIVATGAGMQSKPVTREWARFWLWATPEDVADMEAPPP